jgi:hypothetical protein
MASRQHGIRANDRELRVDGFAAGRLAGTAAILLNDTHGLSSTDSKNFQWQEFPHEINCLSLCGCGLAAFWLR